MSNFYKTLLGIKTNEELYGIDKQPPEQCPKINEIQGVLNDESHNVYEQIKELERQHPEYDTETLDWVAHNTKFLNKNLEELREAIEALRAWGEQWKSLALKAMDKTGTHKEHLSDKAFLRIEKTETTYK